MLQVANEQKQLMDANVVVVEENAQGQADQSMDVDVVVDQDADQGPDEEIYDVLVDDLPNPMDGIVVATAAP
jgi:hypothetical protein